MNRASIEAGLPMARSNLQLQKAHSPILRYGLALLSVGEALGGALFLDNFHFPNVEVPLFLFAVAVSAWYGGAGPSGLALIVSFLTFDYFFVPPLHSLYMTRADLPYFV